MTAAGGDQDLEGRARERVGTTIRGKYRIDSILGVGGMAIVYRATHRNRAEFAVKMLLPELSFNTALRTRFLREGYAANSVKHSGVVQVVDDDVAEDGAAFIVMELLRGESIEALWTLCGKHVPAAVASAIADQLLDVLVAAHENGVVHRDIKPANIFLTSEGVVKVLDFGIARVRDAMATGAQGTGTGVLKSARDSSVIGRTLLKIASWALINRGYVNFLRRSTVIGFHRLKATLVRYERCSST